MEYLKTLRILVCHCVHTVLGKDVDVWQIYGGGPLSVSVGDSLVHAGVRLRDGYGGSEFNNPAKPWDQIPLKSTELDLDWYWHWITDSNMRFAPQGDGTFELVVHVSLCNTTNLGLNRACSLIACTY